MLKYEKIIKHLSLEEKVNLLTTNQASINTMIKNYDLPLFCIIKRVDDYDIPSMEALASTWDKELICEASKEISAHFDNNNIIGIEPCFSKNIQDAYFEGKIAASIISGIEKGKTSACLANIPVNNTHEKRYREAISLPYEIALKDGKPVAFNTKSLDRASQFMNEFNVNGFAIVELDSEYEVIKAINQNLNIVCTSEDAKPIILNALKEYEKLQRLFNGNQISKEEIDAKIVKNEIITFEQLDKVLDRYLDGLAKIDANRLYRFKPNTQVFKEVCDKSIVLLKNDAILPLDFTARPALIGQLAKEPLVYNSFNDLYDDAVASIDYVDFDLTGYDYGYFDDEDNTNLLDAACELSLQSDCAIVYLGVRSGNRLPKNQMDLISRLYDKGVKIIAVITSEEPLIMDFDYMCSAILYSKLSSSAVLKSSMEIIGGKINPTGKTIEYFPANGNAINPEDVTTYKYPFGYGLSYTIVDYENLKVNQDSVEFTLVNSGSYNTNEIVQLYVEYIDENNVAGPRQLRGFKSVPLKSSEPVRISIEFDEYTFRSYFEEEKCYGIKGGKYNILIGRSINEIELMSTIDIEQVLFKYNDHSELVLHTNDERILDEHINSGEDFFKNNIKGLGFKARLAISISLALYVNIALVILTLFMGFEGVNLIFSIIFLVLLVGADAAFVVYFVKLAQEKRRLVKKNIFDDGLELHINMLPQFNQISAFTYPTPKQTVIDEEEIDYVIEEPEEIEPVEEIVKPEAKPETPLVKPITQTEVIENIDFELYVKGFIDYALVYGLIIEPRSARILISALSSAQMVFVRSSSAELLPKLAEITSNYFNSPYRTFALDTASTPFDLMWQVDEDNAYVPTDFALQMKYAQENQKGIVIETLTNVEPTEIIPVLGNIFKFVANPNEKYYLNVEATGTDESLQIPKNLKFIVLENDTKYLEKLPFEVANATLSIEVNIRPNKIIDENADINVKYFTNTLLINTINKLKENNFIPEEYWKKIDDFEESFNNLESYAIHNKAMLIYEKLAGALIESGAEIDEVVDYVIASGIVPCIKSTKTYQNGKGDQTIYTMLEKIFGGDILQMTERTIRKPN